MRVSIFSFILWLSTLAIPAAALYQYPSGAVNIKDQDISSTKYQWGKSATPSSGNDLVRTYIVFDFGKNLNHFNGRICYFSFHGAETSTCDVLELSWIDNLPKNKITKKDFPNTGRAIGSFNSTVNAVRVFTDGGVHAFDCPTEPFFVLVRPPNDPQHSCKSTWNIDSKGLVVERVSE